MADAPLRVEDLLGPPPAPDQSQRKAPSVVDLLGPPPGSAQPSAGLTDYAREAGKGVVRGLGAFAGETAQGVSALGTDVIAPAIRSVTGNRLGHPDDFGLAQAGAGVTAAAQKAAAPAPGWEQSLTGQVGETIGEIAPGVLGGAALPAYFAQGVAGAREQAAAKGASPGQTAAAELGEGAVNLLIGKIPGAESMLKGLPLMAQKGILGYAARTAAAGATGAGIGGVASALTDAVQKYTFDPNKVIGEGLEQQGLVMGLASALLHGATEPFRGAHTPQQAPGETAPGTTPEAPGGTPEAPAPAAGAEQPSPPDGANATVDDFLGRTLGKKPGPGAPSVEAEEREAGEPKTSGTPTEEADLKARETVEERPTEPPAAAPPEEAAPPAEEAAPPTDEGTRDNPVEVKTPEDLEKARAHVEEAPTKDQANAGNYEKGHATVQGVDLALETKKGGTRTDKKNDPPQWTVPDYPADYGYIKGTKGMDGKPIDAFVGPNPKAEFAYIIDQRDPATNTPDEHKVMFGFDSKEQALGTYRAAFPDGSGDSRVGAITPIRADMVKRWAAKGDTQRPFNEQSASVGRISDDILNGRITADAGDIAARYGLKRAEAAKLLEEIGARPDSPIVHTDDGWQRTSEEARQERLAAFEEQARERFGLDREQYPRDSDFVDEALSRQRTADDKRLDSLRNAVAKFVDDRTAGKIDPEALAKSLGADELTVRRILDGLVASGKGIRKHSNEDGGSRYARSPRRGPMDMLQFIAANGGIRDEGDELAGRDLQKHDANFQPGLGNLLRKNGHTHDEMTRMLWEAGYLGPHHDGADRPPITTMYDALDRALGGKKIYSEDDLAELAERESAHPPEVERQAMEQRAQELGMRVEDDWSDEDLLAAIHEREAIMDESPAQADEHGDHLEGEVSETVAKQPDSDDIPWGFEEDEKLPGEVPAQPPPPPVAGGEGKGPEPVAGAPEGVGGAGSRPASGAEGSVQGPAVQGAAGLTEPHGKPPLPDSAAPELPPDQQDRPVESLSPADTLARAGLTIEKFKTNDGREYWAARGDLDTNAKLLDGLGFSKKPFKMKGAMQRSYWQEGDPSARAAAVLRGENDPGRDVGKAPEGDAGTGVEPAQAKSVSDARRREDSRPDERGTARDVAGAVSPETQALIERGKKYGIPEEVMREQVEDVGMIARAYTNGKRAFILANEAGTGKTFVLGGAIRELRASGVKEFTYVTMNKDLIAQIKRDLADYGIEGVNFHTYSELSGDKIKAPNNGVLIFDEAHNIKNMDGTSARAMAAQGIMRDTKFTIFASATPFENPVEATYMGATGMFDSVPGIERPKGRAIIVGGDSPTETWAKIYGASVRRLFEGMEGKRPTYREIVYWPPRGDARDGAAARDWLLKQGIMTQRQMKIEPEKVDVHFRSVPVEQKWVDTYNRVADTYQNALDASAGDNKMTGSIGMHRENALKRILEASKVEHGIARAQELLADGKNVVIFVETKADREMGRWRRSEHFKDKTLYDYPQMQSMMAQWAAQADAARVMGEKPPPRPFADFIYHLAGHFHDAGIHYELPSTADDIQRALGKDNVAIYTGAVTPAAASKNKAAFLAGKKKVLVATMAKGGTGLSLHDTVGNRPTSQINLNLPWKATGIDQVSGRVARYGLQSKATIEWLFANNIPWESEKLAPKVAGRMRDMGALVKGIDLKAAGVLDKGFDYEGLVDVKQGKGEGKLGLAESPTFYSALERNVEDAKQEKAPAAVWKNFIRNLSQKGVKQEEVDWTGVNDWLDQQKGQVAKADLLDAIRVNNVQVKEVTHGDLQDDGLDAIEKWARENLKPDEMEQFGRSVLPALEHGQDDQAIPSLREYGVPEELIRGLGQPPDAPARYRGWTLPGGKNYRELLMTMPQRTEPRAGEVQVPYVEQYHTSHWQEPNVLAHVRFDERTDADGKRALHVAEIQSDWHQQGRKKGYQEEPDRDFAETRAKLIAMRPAVREMLQRHDRLGFDSISEARRAIENDDPANWEIDNPDDAALARQYHMLFQQRVAQDHGGRGIVPDAPFKTSWHEMAMKRMLRYAAEHGFDRVTWDTGATNADRYNLSNHINKLDWEQHNDGTYSIGAVKKDDPNQIAIQQKHITAEKLADYVGKDVAQSIVEGKGRDYTLDKFVDPGGKAGTLSGLDLKVGGEGMTGFYDKMLPAFVNKYAKKWGAKVGETKLSPEDAPDYETAKEMPEGPRVHSVDITPEMRESVLRGQPLFESSTPDKVGEWKNTTPDYASFHGSRGSDQENESARAYVMGRGAATNTEHMAALDRDTGRVTHASTNGMERRVDFGTELEEKLRDPSNSYVVHHNHPRGQALSSGDISSLAQSPGMTWVVAHNPDGGMSAARLTPEMRARAEAAYETATDETTAKLMLDRDAERMDGIHDAVGDAIKPIFKDAIKNGTLSRDEANRVHNDLVNHALAEAGFIDYVSTRPLDSIPSDLLLKAEKAARQAAYQAKYDNLLYREMPDGTNRPAQPVRLDEGMAQLLARGEAGESRGPSGEAGDQQGQEGDRGAGEERRGLSEGAKKSPPIDLSKPELEAAGQTIFPGAEHETPEDMAARQKLEKQQRDKEEAELRMRGRAMANKPQKSAEELPLFGGPRQKEFELSQPEKPVPKKSAQGSLFEEDEPYAEHATPAARRGVTEVTKNSTLGLLVRRLISPGSFDENAKSAAAIIRRAFGESYVNFVQQREKLRSAEERYNTATPAERELFSRAADGDARARAALAPDDRVLAQNLYDVTKKETERLQTLGVLHDAREHYLGRLWKPRGEAVDDSTEAKVLGRLQMKMPITGGKSFLKPRYYDTWEAARASGLEPVFENPIKAHLAKLMEMNRFYAGSLVVRAGKRGGFATFYRDGQARPEGLMELETPEFQRQPRTIQDAEGNERQVPGGAWYAPEGFARVVNNFTSRGLESTLFRDPVRGLRNVGAAMNMLQLGFSAFHPVFTTIDAQVSGLGVAIDNLVRGNFAEAGKQAAMSLTPYNWGKNIADGNRLMKAILAPEDAPPEMRRLVDAFGAAGGRIWMERILRPTDEGAIKFWKSGALGQALREAGNKYPGSPIRQAFNLAGRAIETTSAPVFDIIVPRQKLGVFSRLAHDWLSRNPDASVPEYVKNMQDIWETVDNRLGQMVYDNLFWHKTLKDIAFLTTRSVGWNMGSIREIGGGIAETGQFINKLARGQEAEWTRRMSYLIALPMMTAMYGAMYQYLATGSGPQELKDYFFPKTGLIRTADGQPERISIPTYGKDAYAWVTRPGQTAINKINPLVSLIWQGLQGKDYYGDIIANRDDPLVKQVEDVMGWAVKSITPFSFQGASRMFGERPGWEAGMGMLGVVPAPGYITSPQTEERWDRRQHAAAVKKKARDEQKQDRPIARLPSTTP